MEELIKEMINKGNTFAVVGATNNDEKYGHKVFKAILESKRMVFPINLKTPEILGEDCYASVLDVPVIVNVVVFVVPPDQTLKVLKEVAQDSTIENVWLQEGSENQEAIDFCAEKKINCVYGGPCIMTELNKSAG
ncbi:MAG: CoA-binding protein [Parcubacteria group bacterium]|nr:CoA-binding protein [Parcubacteria group bacterium]|tara:strand:+ start:193 stop:597 length:405 start_codon:yes stop_codon:yes gene_type:complete